MAEAVPAAHFNLFLLPNFLDVATCASLKAELIEAPTTQAPVYIQGTEGTIHETIRKTTSMHPSQETFNRIHERLQEQTFALSQHFGENLIDCEPPQFLRYEKGDFLCVTRTVTPDRMSLIIYGFVEFRSWHS